MEFYNVYHRAEGSVIPLPSDTRRLKQLSNNDTYLNGFAKFVGISRAEVIEGIENQTKELLKDVVPAIRVPIRRVMGIFRDGMFRSVHEVGNTQSFAQVSDYVQVRHEGEASMFGEGSRPVYGYLKPKEVAYHGGVSHYGELEFILKPEILDRCTYTLGDSLSQHDTIIPAPVHFPNYRASAGPQYLTKRAYNNPLSYPLVRGFSSGDTVSYVELQVHGGLTVDDIASVNIEYHNYQNIGPRMRKFLDNIGSPFSMYRIWYWNEKKPGYKFGIK